MEDDIKCCGKRSCQRYRIGVIRPHSRYCSHCGSKLRNFWAINSDASPECDVPIITDLSPDHRSVTHSSKGGHMHHAYEVLDAPKDKIPFPTRTDWLKFKDTDDATWNGYAILIRMLGLTEFADSEHPWHVYEGTYLALCGAGTMTADADIKALIARVKAYATKESLDWDKYTSWNHPSRQHGNSEVRTTGIAVLNPAKPKGPSDVFSCDPTDIEPKCPIQPKASVIMPYPMWHNFIHLARKFSTEWLAYLCGDKLTKEDGTVEWYVTDFYFPPQRCTSAHVDVQTGYRCREGTIGDIHSHVDMGAFFSSEDTKHFNWPVHIVINRKAEAVCAIAHTLECGRTTRLPGTIYTVAAAEQEALATALSSNLETASPNRHKGVN
jgi:proteasome lid subunit RPN8/RPN11